MPTLFSDAGWDKLNNTILSTSNCGNPSLRQFGFGPTSGDGFGIGYIIKDGSVSICASSKHRQTKRFVDALEAYFLEIRKLLRATKKSGTSQPGQSRVRQVEEQGRRGSRMKSRGRMITGEAKPGKEMATPQEEEVDEDEDGLGGYGFFDAGMLLSALRANQKDDDKPSEQVIRRKEIGKRLVLAEY